MSVWLKSFPLKSSASPVDFARAYAKQSPKFRSAFVTAALPEIAIGVPGDTSLVVCHRFDTQFRDID